MCWCRPEIRTPQCNRPGCHPPTMTPTPNGGLARVEGVGHLWSVIVNGSGVRITTEGTPSHAEGILDRINSAADAFAQKAVDEKLEDVASFLDGQGQPGYADQIRAMKSKGAV